MMTILYQSNGGLSIWNFLFYGKELVFGFAAVLYWRQISRKGDRMIREIRDNELNELLRLYLHLHEDSVPDDDRLRHTWERICADDNHHIIVNEVDGEIVSSCVCVIIPNLTRNVRPYALIENVVTHSEYRGKGYATACLEYARELAKSAGCYKMMLLTGSKDESTLRFYQRAGYNCTDKTAFIQWL